MAGKRQSRTTRRKIDFHYDSPDAKEVFLAGTFNAWSLKKHPMKNMGEGHWHKALMLPPGSYEYKFWVDGQWSQDPLNDRCCQNCFGTQNNVVKVPG